jgi:hypothetical protein
MTDGQRRTSNSGRRASNAEKKPVVDNRLSAVDLSLILSFFITNCAVDNRPGLLYSCNVFLMEGIIIPLTGGPKVRKADRVAVLAAVLVGLGGCGGGGGTSSIDMPAGAASPEEAVETFLNAANEAQEAKAAGEFERVRVSYERMAAVFGTDQGSISRSYPEQEVRDRMIVLAACIRPVSFRIVSSPDFSARDRGEMLVTAEIARTPTNVTLPFRVILARDDRWYIEQIILSLQTFEC